MKYLIVGLGNPEGKYFNTYHNVGFLAVEQITKDFKKKGNQMLAKIPTALILKPLTYMNLSGQAVLAVVRKHKIAPENVIVIYDDLYIDKGHIRVSFGGSGAGHNGIKSITELLGTDKYLRVRIGIKPNKEPHTHASYVLSKIQDDLPIASAAQAAIDLTTTPLDKVQGVYNAKNTATV